MNSKSKNNSVYSLSISLIWLFLSSCSSPVNENKLIKSLTTNHIKLEPIAELILSSGDGTIIDLRDKPVRIEPNTLSQNLKPEWLKELKHLNISFATFDRSFNGVLFEIEGNGIGISGSSAGYIYFQSKPEDSSIELVEDIEKTFKQKKAALKKNESLDVKLVKKVKPSWGIYLETF